MNKELISVQINEIEYEIREENEEITIMQACLENGIEIPRFCYHEKLSIAGNCRMCLVYISNDEKLLAACGVPINMDFDGELILTEVDEIIETREGVLELLLINHPLDCPICDQGGECDLQEQTIRYGLDTGRFYIKKRAVDIKNFGFLIRGIMTRCIHCTRCVRFLTEIAGINDLGVLGRGYNMEIGTFKKNKKLDSELSGNIIDLCPVGALTSAVYANKGRPWELKTVKGRDIFDSILTPINYQIKGTEIYRILPRINDNINEEWLTDKRNAYSNNIYIKYGKSAQLGLHMWLPDAMEGPTPVSALLHAATMVTAGVFLVLRCSPLLSALTTVFATTVGVVQNDIKRVIAYSTCSQLGYMIFACGLLNYNASIYHLTTHAFFKALLFLSAGSVIHSLSDEQDMRKMGGLVNLLPLTYQYIILETSYATYYWEGAFASLIGYVAAFGTTFYSFRLLFLTFYNKPRMSLNSIKKVHEVI
eukprot:gene363-459_t